MPKENKDKDLGAFQSVKPVELGQRPMTIPVTGEDTEAVKEPQLSDYTLDRVYELYPDREEEIKLIAESLKKVITSQMSSNEWDKLIKEYRGGFLFESISDLGNFSPFEIMNSHVRGLMDQEKAEMRKKELDNSAPGW